MRCFADPILPDNVDSLINGDHTRKIHKATPTTGGLMGFVKKTQRCFGCKATLHGAADNENALCGNCKPREAELYLQKMADLSRCARIGSRARCGVGAWASC